MTDIIGTLYDGADPPAALPGWHVNSPEPVTSWAAYEVQPATPHRVFAGHSTFFYVFPDQAAFEALIPTP